jgi:hypothetical protein
LRIPCRNKSADKAKTVVFSEAETHSHAPPLKHKDFVFEWPLISLCQNVCLRSLHLYRNQTFAIDCSMCLF